MAMMVVAIAEPKPEAIAIAMGAKVVNVVEVVSKAIIVVKVVLIATLLLVLLVRVVVALVRLRVLGIQGFPAPLWCEPEAQPVKGETGFYTYLCFSFPCQTQNV